MLIHSIARGIKHSERVLIHFGRAKAGGFGTKGNECNCQRLSFSILKQEFQVSIIELAKERLTAKQKFILKFINNSKEQTNVTNFVSIISKKISCSKTAVWNNLRSLKKVGVLEFSDSKNKGLPIRLSKIGSFLTKFLDGGQDGN